jgi:RNA polymerase sigma factor (sigma-70 family)
MRMRTDSPVDLATVVAARAGDQRAMDDLVAGCLPLVYNIVGRALCGHADVDDVVQESMLRVVRGLADLVDPASFRSWLVAVAMSQVRQRHRGMARDRIAAPPGPSRPDAADLDDLADPGADFVDLTILRLELTGQRQEVVRATRWLDAEDREVLSLWWLELAGALTRPELAGALGLSREHAAVTIQRTRARLEVARSVIRALDAMPRCPRLADLVAGWDTAPGPLWRKRLARHVRECDRCWRTPVGVVSADWLLADLPLLPPACGAGHPRPPRVRRRPPVSPGRQANRPGDHRRARPGWPAGLAYRRPALLKPALAAPRRSPLSSRAPWLRPRSMPIRPARGRRPRVPDRPRRGSLRAEVQTAPSSPAPSVCEQPRPRRRSWRRRRGGPARG